MKAYLMGAAIALTCLHPTDTSAQINSTAAKACLQADSFARCYEAGGKSEIEILCNDARDKNGCLQTLKALRRYNTTRTSRMQLTPLEIQCLYGKTNSCRLINRQ